VGRYTTATNLINVSTGAFTTPDQVRFVVNNAFADNALCGGDPFKCAIRRNTYRAQPRNQIDLAIAKSINVTERVHLQLRGDGFNVFNYSYRGVPGLNINTPNLSAQNTFGNVAYNTGTRRSFVVSGHVTF